MGGCSSLLEIDVGSPQHSRATKMEKGKDSKGVWDELSFLSW